VLKVPCLLLTKMSHQLTTAFRAGAIARKPAMPRWVQVGHMHHAAIALAVGKAGCHGRKSLQQAGRSIAETK
jgi:hypothetical protein